MRSAALLITSLSLVGCGSLPPFPEIYQCAFYASQNAFYCVNSSTKEEIKLPVDSPKMRGAQCMSLEDYRKSESWVQTVKQIAETRCR